MAMALGTAAVDDAAPVERRCGEGSEAARMRVSGAASGVEASVADACAEESGAVGIVAAGADVCRTGELSKAPGRETRDAATALIGKLPIADTATAELAAGVAATVPGAATPPPAAAGAAGV